MTKNLKKTPNYCMSAVEFMDVYCGTKENSDENGNQVATFKAMVEATDGLKPTGME